MNTLLDKIQSPPAVAIADLVREKERLGEKIAKLQSGEPCFTTPDYIREALYNALKDGHTGYTASQGILGLREALSTWYQEDFGVTVSPEEILINVGAIGAIYCVMNTLLNKGDKVVIVDPCWPQYVNIVNLLGATPVRIPTRVNKGRLSAELLGEYLGAGTKLLILNNPSNPSGVVYSEEEIAAFVRLAAGKGIYVLVDEVYNRLLFTKNFSSVLECGAYQEHRKRIIYINSFSKVFAMTGWRIGYAFMDKALLKEVLKVSQNIFTNVATFCQYAAQDAITEMKHHKEEFARMHEVYEKRYHELMVILENKGIEYMKPEGAFYFFFRVNQESVEFAKMLLARFKMAVVPGSSYGEEFNDYIRISFAVDDYSYSVFLNWLKNEFNP